MIWTSRWMCSGSPKKSTAWRTSTPRRFGIIVQTADGRQALLLPDLEGVDTPEQQVSYHLPQRAASTPTWDKYRLFRFQVERHH